MGIKDKAAREAADENAEVGALALAPVDMGKEEDMPDTEEMRAKMAEAVEKSVNQAG